jgi:exopolysaccharide production protein ExoZ
VVRIYPAYWLALVPVVAAHAYLRHNGVHILGGEQDAQTNVLATLFLLPHPVNQFLSLPPAWTLVFEMSFYIVFAFLLSLRQRLMLPALATWFVVEVVMAFAFARSDNFILVFLGTPLPLEFIAGAFTGLLYVHGRLAFARFTTVAAVLSIAALWLYEIGIGDVAYAHVSVSAERNASLSTYHNTLGRVLFAGVPAFLAVYSAVALEAHGTFRAPTWLVKLGDSSYALYLWNLTVIVAARQLLLRLHPHGMVAHVLGLGLTFAAVVGASLLVWRFFEHPVTNRLHRLLAKEVVVGGPVQVKAS